MYLNIFGRIKRFTLSALEARTLLPFAFLLMLAFLVALAWDGFSRTRELLNSQAYVEHTHQVLHEMEGIEDGLQDAREAWLHYILTPEKQDLDTFEGAVAKVWMQVDRVSYLTQDDPVHQAKIRELRNWISDELLQLRDNLRTSKTLLIYHSQDTDFRRDRVRDAIQKFKEEEELLLRERNMASQLSAKEVERSVSVRIGGFVLVMAILFTLVMRESKKLRIAERSALDAQARLEGSLERLQSETESSKCLNELQADLQICVNASEAFDVLSGYSQRLIPASAGAVFAIDNTHNLMGTMASWGESDSPSQNLLAPEDCCAMRGSRLHVRLQDPKALSCHHFSGTIPPAYICLPLSALGETLGILHISGESADLFTAPRLSLIQQLGEYAALRLANLKLREKLHDQSIRDPLTSLYNRRFLQATMEQEVRRSARRHSGLGVMMVDIDKFKNFNDTFGHEAGDMVLKEVAFLLRRAVRTEDIVCRFGGEEFVVVMPDSSPDSVQERAELVRNTIANLKIEHNSVAMGKITVSIGISFSHGGDLTPDMLLRYADEALYHAKKMGADRVSLSSSVPAFRGSSPDSPQGSDKTMRKSV